MLFVHINREKDIDIAFAQHTIDEYKVALSLYSILFTLYFVSFVKLLFDELYTIILFWKLLSTVGSVVSMCIITNSEWCIKEIGTCIEAWKH